MTQAETMDKPRAGHITTRGISACFRAGLADFRRAPVFGIIIGSLFAAIGVLVFLQLLVWKSTYWLIPIAVGFPLVGPLLAVGLYEMSKRIEAGSPLDWSSIISVMFSELKGQVQWIVYVALFIYLVWVYIAHLIFALTFGLKPLTNIMTSYEVFFTTEGLMMLVIGTVVGGILAFILFASTAVSIPMLMDREVDFATAIIVSFQVVLNNKRAMLTWGAIVGALSLVAMLPMFLLMPLVFPILGHTTWHIYRRSVDFDES